MYSCVRIVFRALMIVVMYQLFLSPVGCQNAIQNSGETGSDTPFIRNTNLARSVNLGNALEAPNEGEWGVTLEARFFTLIAEKNFTAVRIPIRWNAHAEDTPPYTISESFFDRVDWAVDQALANDLAVVMNIHHYNALMDNPADHKDRFLALWKQIGEHYQDAPREEVFFELLNEPHNNLDPRIWNIYLAEAIDVIRSSNPDRTLIVGPGNWNNVHALAGLRLPGGEDNVIVTVHYYEPFHFTHQGADWVGDQSEEWLGTSWTATDPERSAVRADLDKASSWAENTNRPLFLGEFGAYSEADMESRAPWTNVVAREAERRGISWAYWEFCAGFGIYDDESEEWRLPLLQALIPSN